jgi:hypothetical protein
MGNIGLPTNADTRYLKSKVLYNALKLKHKEQGTATQKHY